MFSLSLHGRTSGELQQCLHIRPLQAIDNYEAETHNLLSDSAPPKKCNQASFEGWPIFNVQLLFTLSGL